MRENQILNLCRVMIVALLSSAALGLCGDNNVLWDHLYHNDSGAYDPTTEFVPYESYTFRSVDATGHVYPFTEVTIYFMCDWGDLTSANVVYSTGGGDVYVAMSWVKNITASFHGQPSRTYDLWSATIPAHSAGTTVWYRVQANDGSASAFLKYGNSAGGAWQNPVGQWVRNPDVPASDNWSYTVEDAPIAVEMNEPCAIACEAGVDILWSTMSEVDVAGFHVLRSNDASERFTQIDDGLIAAVGSEPSGASYHYCDEHGTLDCHYQLEIVHLDGSRESTGIFLVSQMTHVNSETKPLHFALQQNYPNPFNPETVIRYDLPRASVVDLSIYNAHGHLVLELVRDVQASGNYSVLWDAKDAFGQNVSSGLYLYQLKTDGFCQTRKMTVLR